MKSKPTIMLLPTLLALMGVFLGGCIDSAPDSPRAVVINLFGAMEKDDKATIAHLLDLAELMKSEMEDYAFHSDDEPRIFTSPQQILDDLTGEGLTKQRWFSMQRIIGDAEITGEIASVEVTFVDKEVSKGYLTKFGLHIKNGKWKIYSFKALG